MKITTSDFLIRIVLPIVNLVMYLFYRKNIDVSKDFDYFYGSFSLFILIASFGTLINSLTNKKLSKKLLIILLSYSIVNIVFLIIIFSPSIILESKLYLVSVIFYSVLIILSFYRMVKKDKNSLSV